MAKSRTIKTILCTAAIIGMSFAASCDRVHFSYKTELPHQSAPGYAAQYSADDKSPAGFQNKRIINISCDEKRYHCGLLDASERILYDSFLNAFLDFEESVNVHGFENDRIYYVRSCVLRDFPEIWYIGNGSITEYHKNGSVIDKEYVIEYLYGIEDIRNMQKEIEANVDRILESVDPEAADYEKLVFVYETIIKNTSYDQTVYEIVESDGDDSAVTDSASVYGVFVKGKAICEGYSKAAQYLLGRLGIECGFASGTAKKDGVAHAWNFVTLDGEPYFLDLTWGDPVCPDFPGSAVLYDYFCITTEQLLNTHVPDPAYPLPNCTAKRYEYFAYNELLLKEYSLQAVFDILKKAFALNKESACVKFADDKELYKAIKDLIENEAIFSLLQRIKEEGIKIDTGSYFYTLDDCNRILTIYPKFF
ncbi:MAG: hypothetical protein BWY11_02136 [Firmicutes bacterium ADurb.Bin182]|nr:MAG: hypothetical protein BWY11_02136 [Firmicutes bacterium ADurb.Bin182]